MRPTVLQLGKSQVARSSLASIRSAGLEEVGQFQDEQQDGNSYLAGQSFVHRIFGYRGVILYPWQAHVLDMDLRRSNNEAMRIESLNINEIDTTSHAPVSPGSNNIEPGQGAKLFHPHSVIINSYYKVLIDARDRPKAFPGTQVARYFNGNKSITAVGDLDDVAHEDILPYKSNEHIPIEHELHKKLFRFDRGAKRGSKFIPTDLLDEWRNRQSLLGLQRVYKGTTENVRVTVIPFYLGCFSIGSTPIHWWRYCIRLENFNEFEVELRQRNLKIFSQANMLQTIEKQEIAGAGLRLTRMAPACQFQSHVNLRHRRGHMWGTFGMEGEGGHKFECKIPHFYLESPQEIDL